MVVFTKQEADAIVQRMVGSQEFALRWWDSPNYAFGLETPENTWRQDPNQVWQYLCFHAEKNGVL